MIATASQDESCQIRASKAKLLGSGTAGKNYCKCREVDVSALGDLWSRSNNLQLCREAYRAGGSPNGVVDANMKSSVAPD